MNRDDIIKLAREAGISESHAQGMQGFLDAFAALVAAAEHEKVAAWMMQRGFATGHGDTVDALLNELEWQVAEREREACAKVCEEYDGEYDTHPKQTAEGIALQILARGNK